MDSSSCCSSKNNKKCFWAGAVIVVIIAIFALAKVVNSARMQPDGNLYQVVVLYSDQAFFGKLHAVNSAYPYLTDVYYLKPVKQATDATGRLLSSNEQYNVIKRGESEIHAPTDKLYLNRKNILYWENVGADSLVTRGIQADKTYKATGKGPEGVPVINQQPAPAAPLAPAPSPDASKPAK